MTTPTLPRWYLAYFVLAAFDLLTITSSLYMNHSITHIFSRSVEQNKTWATLLSQLEDLRHLAGEVNAPGNDVFDTREVTKESARVQQAKLLFDQEFTKLQAAFEEQHLERSYQQELSNIQTALSSMEEEADQIFTFFREGQPQQAGERMATMDRKFASANVAITALNRHIQRQQLAKLQQDQDYAASLQVYEYLISFFILCMISGAILYGNKIHRQIVSSTKEREAMLVKLTKATESAESAAKAKSDFLTMMSHEIRTPLNGVIGMTELLQLTQLTPQQQTQVATIQSSAQSLSMIINDVLDFAKIEAGKLSTQNISFSLLEVFEDTFSALAPLAHKKQLELLCNVAPHLPEQLQGDPFRFRQVLVNLIGNALKFTEEGHVQLTTTLIEKSQEDILIKLEVSDTGCGIRVEDQQKLFTAFTQTSNVNIRKHGGTGLGLAISKRMVEALGGEIGVSSEEGRGSTFWFTARFTRREATKPEVLPVLEKVLIIDDNKINRQILHDQLSSWNIPNESAANGEEGLSLLREAMQRQAPYSLVILDYHMPGMNGIEVASELHRTRAEFGEAKILLLTSVGGLQEEYKGLVDQALAKPVTRRSLLRGLQALFEPSLSVTKTSGAEPSTKRLLLAEDNPVNQMVVLGMLNALGYQADIAQNGQEVILASQRKSYDLILMDCQMPLLDGYEATRQLRALQHRTPIIALTAHAVEGAREQALAAGMDDYLPKPVTLKQLKEALALWLHPTTRADAITTPVQAERPLWEDAGVSKKIIALFAQLGPAQKGSILYATDAQARAEAAHKLKGSALSLGLPRLSALCATIEEKSNQQEDTSAELLELEKVFEDSLFAIKASAS
jgi:signal transduction histidine kinase/DNA-binding response OmpR family regulator